MRTISLKLEDGLDQRLVAAARMQRTSKSKLVRTAVEAWLDEKPIGTGSCLDLAKDLVGSAEGPPDLSTHPRHMKGFGK
jgi:hypothetical protein